MPALVKDSCIRGVASSYTNRTRRTSTLLGVLTNTWHMQQTTALKTADQRKHAHQKGEGSTSNTQAVLQPSKAGLFTVHCPLFCSHQTQMTSWWVPIPIQAHFIVKKDMAGIFSVSSSPENRCRENEEISKGMERWWVDFSVSLWEARERVRSHCQGKRGRNSSKKKKRTCRLLRFLKPYCKWQQEIWKLRCVRDFNSWLNTSSLFDLTVRTGTSKNIPVIITGYLSYFCSSLVVEVTIPWKLL